jgi:hypothetical protein
MVGEKPTPNTNRGKPASEHFGAGLAIRELISRPTFGVSRDFRTSLHSIIPKKNLRTVDSVASYDERLGSSSVGGGLDAIQFRVLAALGD